ncbi:MAG: DUF2605 family protein [Cyanobium sp.]
MTMDQPNSDFGADSAGALLEQLLSPLLVDFQESFTRGLLLLDHCPEAVLTEPQQQALRQRLEEGLAGLAAARVLRQATPAPMALDMATIQPWHQLVVEVWSLSAAMRAAGAAMP